MAKDIILAEGTVVEALPDTLFRVQLTAGATEPILCHLSGRMRMHRIRILPGDRVQVELSPYDLTRGRISRRQDPRAETQ